MAVAATIIEGDDGQLYIRELRVWRERRGMTQKALAKAISYDPSRVSHIEAGRQKPTEQFTRQADAALQTGGVLWDIWERIAAENLGAPLHQPERELRMTGFVAWLAEHSDAGFPEIYGAVNTRVQRLEAEPPSVRYGREHSRKLVERHRIAETLVDYYGHGDAPSASFYRARVGRTEILTSILTRPAWLDTAVPLGGDAERFTFVPPAPPPSSFNRLADGLALDAAIQRLASVELNGTVMVNNPLYRLLDVQLEHGELSGTVSTVDFAHHSLTAELMEGELLDAIVANHDGPLPLRDAYLPTARAAFALDERVCVGGPVSLLAIARRTHYSGERDYVLLTQERSSNVLNAAGGLGVIPKAFHQPTGEPGDETLLSVTLRREFEEELLGRQDLEQIANGQQRHVDLLHEQHVTEPMAWLLENSPESYRTECTGLGFNMVTSNFEFPCLIVIDDEHWWDRYGGLVETNWEAVRVNRYSSRDAAGLETLVQDPRWGNESLFSLLQGLRRLAEVGEPERLALPEVVLEV